MTPNRTVAVEQLRRARRPKPAPRWRNLWNSPLATLFVDQIAGCELLSETTFLGSYTYATAEAAEQAAVEGIAEVQIPPDALRWLRAVPDPHLSLEAATEGLAP